MINLIAETAWHHEGDFDFMKKLIQRIIKSPANIVKLHITVDINEYMAKDHPAYSSLLPKMFTPEQWDTFIKLVNDAGKSLMLLLNDTKAVEFGMKYNPKYIEVHSVCLNDLHLLKSIRTHITSENKVVLGVGGSTIYEIEHAIHFLQTENVILMHGFQNYPTKYENINFSKIRKLSQLYPHYEHGYADHTAWDEPNNLLISIMGASLGMKYIEKHVTLKPGEERTDWQSAISFKQLDELYNKLQVLDSCNGSGKLELNNGEKQYSKYGLNKKAPVFTREHNSNEHLKPESIKFIRTSKNTDISQLATIEEFGKTLNTKKYKGDILFKADLNS